DDAGRLNHVGVSSAFTMKVRRELVRELAPLRRGALAHHPWREPVEPAEGDGAEPARRLPGATSRWSAGKDLSWLALRPEAVCEVRYDHLQGDRFRHAATFLRWRPDKPPEACRYDQLETVAPFELERIFAAAA
ncbi:MAG: ATP dependent DNA ligase, partial [Caldimonas sp.]